MRRLLIIALATCATVCATGAVALPASAQGAVLDRPRSGADAIAALGQHLSEIAAAHQTTADVLRQRLRDDPTLWVDVDGQLFYVEATPTAEATTAGTTATSATSAPLTRTGVLSLHSRPGAQRTIYLDVDGFGGTWGGKVGSSWAKSYTGGDGVAEPYSLDTDLANFSADELADIQSMWEHVAEDYAPFDIDVTTHEPPFETINRADASDQVYGTRVAITSSATSCGCGGVAYVGVFDDTGTSHASHQPAFVYTEGGKWAAEAASHEAGHTLGLSHDGRTLSDGTTEGYYRGHGDWAPIMGVGYYEPIAQWSKGEYAGANNPEDDFAVVVSNGGPLRTDAADAVLSPGARVDGVIETAGDVDTFTYTPSEDGQVTFDVSPTALSPNLDVRATLAGPDGDLVADPPSSAVSTEVANGVGAALTASLSAGVTYTLRVEGVGKGDPATDGYSDYGSVGAYTVAVSGTAPAPVVAPSGVPALVGSVSSGTVRLSWTGTWADALALDLQVTKDGVAQQSVPIALGRTAYSTAPGAGTWIYRLRAVNRAGDSGWSAPVSATIAATTVKKGNGRK